MRQCGGCTLCCKLLPVHDGVLVDGVRQQGNLDKDAGERCRYQRHHKGCAVYHTARMPTCCKIWNCRWLVNDDTADLSRPDRAHYVIDIMPDFVTLVDNASGERTNMEVIQVWCDPNYPDAHRDPALRRYLNRQQKMAIVRYNSSQAIHLCPPSVASDHVWHELEGHSLGREHTPTEIVKALAE